MSCHVQLEEWDGSKLDIKSTVTKNGHNCKGIWGIMSSLTMTIMSYPKGKYICSLNLLTGIYTVLGEQDAIYGDLMATGTAFFPRLYCQRNSLAMNAAKYDI